MFMDPPPPIVIVARDDGGYVDQYLARIAKMRRAKTKFVLDGKCYSSCTLATALPKFCATAGSSLHFHMPYIIESDGRHTPDPAYATKMMLAYPEPIRNWIESKGGLPQEPNWITLEGKALGRLVPICTASR